MKQQHILHTRALVTLALIICVAAPIRAADHRDSSLIALDGPFSRMERSLLRDAAQRGIDTNDGMVLASNGGVHVAVLMNSSLGPERPTYPDDFNANGRSVLFMSITGAERIPDGNYEVIMFPNYTGIMIKGDGHIMTFKISTTTDNPNHVPGASVELTVEPTVVRASLPVDVGDGSTVCLNLEEIKTP